MVLNQLFYNDSHIDDEVSFILELTSLLQIHFKQDVTLKISTDRDLDSLIDNFFWNKKPSITTTGPSKECICIELGEAPPKEGAKQYIVSSTSTYSGDNKFVIPVHLLKSSLEGEEIKSAKAYTVARLIHEDRFSSAIPEKKISLFYSDELKEWLSLVEATEGIISFWYRQRDEHTDLELIDLASLQGQGELKRVAFHSQKAVFVKVTSRSAQAMKVLRGINPDLPFVVHGFESASVYFANTFHLGLQEIINSGDLWILSCEGDRKLTELSWKNLNTIVKPLKFPTNHRNQNIESDCRNLLFFGRITEQKNLHEGIFAVKLLEDRMREEKTKFKIFGYEDFLGVPNLRIPSLGYLEYLYKLVKKLKIQDLVEFHPAVSVKQMETEFRNGVFFSPSVHSDENFGLVAFRALSKGVPALLSHWGGHSDFAEYFTNIVYFNVYLTGSGPKTNPMEVASIISKFWDHPLKPQVKGFPDFELPRKQESGSKLKMTQDKSIVENRVKDSFPWIQRKWPLYGKIFRSYQDDVYLKAMRAYGGLSRQEPEAGKTVVSPEVEILDSEIKVLDCRAGVLRYPRKDENHHIRLLSLGMGECQLSSSEWRWLWEKGYLFSKESYEL